MEIIPPKIRKDWKTIFVYPDGANSEEEEEFVKGSKYVAEMLVNAYENCVERAKTYDDNGMTRLAMYERSDAARYKTALELSGYVFKD